MSTEVKSDVVESTEVKSDVVESTEVKSDVVESTKKRAAKVAQFVADPVLTIARSPVGTYPNGKPRYAPLIPTDVQVTIPMLPALDDEGKPVLDADGGPVSDTVPWSYVPLRGKDTTGKECQHPDPLRLGVEIPTPAMFGDWLAYWTWIGDVYVTQFGKYVEEQRKHWADKPPEERVFKKARSSKEQQEAKVTKELYDALSDIDLDSIKESDPEKMKEALFAAILAKFQSR